jgi:CubicO group peptidase (beta-lactamase class C family)
MTVAGLSRMRLRKMHEVMASHVDGGKIPGLVTIVGRREEVHVDAVGVRTAGNEEPMRPDSIFRISSMTKPVTGVATMILVEDCKLRLDDPVERYIPELADRKVLKQIDGPVMDTMAANRSITVRDLLTFRMGFGIIMAPPGTYPIQKAIDELHLGQGPPAPSVPPSPDEWIRNFATLPLMHQPGEKWMYNTGADVLGVLIARASGMPFEKFLSERIFDPLGMKDTAFYVPSTKVSRFTSFYHVNPQTGNIDLGDEPDGGQWSTPPAFPSGAAGLVSTAEDYHSFARMLLDGGKKGRERILSRPSIELMTSDQLTPEQKKASGLTAGFFDTHGWGFCVSVVTRRETFASIGTYGWDGGMGTSWASDPKEDLIGILMTPVSWTSPSPPPVCVDFWTSVYQTIDD